MLLQCVVQFSLISLSLSSKTFAMEEVVSNVSTSNCSSELYTDSNSTNFTNMSLNCTPTPQEDPARLLIILSSINIAFFIVPTFIMGTIILPIMIKDKKTAPTLQAVFIATTIMCLLALIPLLLRDLSEIFDVPLIGRCTPGEQQLYSAFLRLFLLFLVWYNLMLAIVFYLGIRGGAAKCCSLKVVIGILIALVPIGVVINIAVAAAWVGITDHLVFLRGSVCMLIPKGAKFSSLLTGVFSIIAFLIPAPLTIIFVVLSCYRVKSKVVSMDKKILRSMVLFVTSMIIVTFVVRIPPLLLTFVRNGSGTRNLIFSRISLYCSELNFTLFLLLVMVMHQAVRNKLKKVCLCRWNALVQPESRYLSRTKTTDQEFHSAVSNKDLLSAGTSSATLNNV